MSVGPEILLSMIKRWTLRITYTALMIVVIALAVDWAMTQLVAHLSTTSEHTLSD